MAKMLSSSLLRNYTAAEIVLFKAFADPVFRVARSGLTEVFIKDISEAHNLKYAVRDFLDVAHCDWVFYLDADCLALRDIDHLLIQEADLLVAAEPGAKLRDDWFGCYFSDTELAQIGHRCGYNSGSWAIRGRHFRAFTELWEEINSREPYRQKFSHDQEAFNRTVHEAGLVTRTFERGEVQMPFRGDSRYESYRNAALLHFVGPPPEVKLELMTGIYLNKFFGANGWLVNFLDM